MQDIQHRVVWLLGILAAGMLTTGVQLYRLTVQQSPIWRTQAEEQIMRVMPSHGPRGAIYDTKGRSLATSEPAFAAVLVRRDARYVDEVLPKLAALIAGDDPQKAQAIIDNVRRRMEQEKKYEPLVVASKLERPIISQLVERRSEFPGLILVTEAVRNYTEGSLAGSLLGYVGPISLDQLTKEGFSEYQGDETVGKDGLESAYERYLQGQPGERSVVVDYLGRPMGEFEETPPVPGHDLHLSLDLELQRVAEAVLMEQIEWIEQQNDPEANPIRASLVMQDVRSGAILAMASVPTFDPNLFVTGMSDAQWNELASHPARPMQNWALAGYPPGSIYKMGVGLAGLEAKAVGPYERINCAPVYWNYHRPRNWTPYSQGPADVARALAISCDPFFYEVGYRMTIDPLAAYLEQFGFGRVTGIDLPGEQAGANPTEKSYGAEWSPGQVLSVAIGQGHVLTTPLQLANYTATVASSGARYRPYLVEEVRTAAGELLFHRDPELVGQVTASDQNWERIHQGMRLAVTSAEGTAHSAFVDFPVAVAAKTGSAETGYPWANALTVAYAPYDKPEIAVAVVVEGGSHGSWVAPVARAVMAKYFGLAEEQISGRSMPKAD